MTTSTSRINGRILLQGILTNKSPLLVGTGRGEQVDAEIARLPDGRPFIPGTSLAGALRHHLEAGFSMPAGADAHFWGSRKTAGKFFQSHFVLDDLLPVGDSPPRVAVRDGVSISAQTGIARDERKYEYEVLEPGARFKFSAEATLRDGFDRNAFLSILQAIAGELAAGRIRLGALTSKGFGLVELEDWRLCEFRFPGGPGFPGGADWLRFCATGDLPVAVNDPFKNIRALTPKKSAPVFTITAEFRLRGSLIIGAPGEGDADKGTLKSAGCPVISGPSLKGALRARASRIVKTLDGDAKILDNLFGWAEENAGRRRRARKSRLLVEENAVPAGAATDRPQARIRVDRFTGGVHSHFLFDSRPLWRTGDGDLIAVRLILKDYQAWEAGLLLLLLRDLWTGDLPLGGEKNVGRGVLEGVRATVAFSGGEIEIAPADGSAAETSPDAPLEISWAGDGVPRQTLEDLVDEFYLFVTV